MTFKLEIQPCSMGGFHVLAHMSESTEDRAFTDIGDLTAWLGDRFGGSPQQGPMAKRTIPEREFQPKHDDPAPVEARPEQELVPRSFSPPMIEREQIEEPAPEAAPDMPPILSNADALILLITENGGTDQWVKLTYGKIQDYLGVSAPVVKSTIDDLVMSDQIMVHRVTSGPDTGNWFSIAPENGGKAEPFAASAPETPAPAKPAPKAEPIDDEDADSVLGALIDISERLNSRTIEINCTSLAKKAEVEPGAIPRLMMALEKEGSVSLGQPLKTGALVITLTGKR